MSSLPFGYMPELTVLYQNVARGNGRSLASRGGRCVIMGATPHKKSFLLGADCVATLSATGPAFVTEYPCERLPFPARAWACLRTSPFLWAIGSRPWTAACSVAETPRTSIFSRGGPTAIFVRGQAISVLRKHLTNLQYESLWVDGYRSRQPARGRGGASYANDTRAGNNNATYVKVFDKALPTVPNKILSIRTECGVVVFLRATTDIPKNTEITVVSCLSCPARRCTEPIWTGLLDSTHPFGALMWSPTSMHTDSGSIPSTSKKKRNGPILFCFQDKGTSIAMPFGSQSRYHSFRFCSHGRRYNVLLDL